MEVGNWWGNSWQPSSRQNQFGLAIQGLQEAAGTAGDQIKSYGSNLLKSLTEESDEKKTDLHQSAESLMGVVGAGPLDLAAEFALSQIHRLPEHLRTPAVVTSLLIGSLDGGVPRLRGNNARRINNLLGINSVGTGTSYHANPQPRKGSTKKQALEAAQSLRKLHINGNGNGLEDDLKNSNTSTPVRNRNNPDLSIFKPKTGKRISDAITPEGVEGIYGVTKGKKQIPHPEQRPLSGDVELHHKVGKDIRFDFTEQANNLDPEGQAALDAIDAEYGLQSGSGADALTPYNSIPHNRIHNSERRFLNTKDSFMSGNEPSGRFLKELRNDIAGASSLKELKKLYRDYIERSVLPFNKNADHFQRAFEKAGTPKTMTEAELKNYAKLQKAQEEALHDLKIERAMELLDFPIN